jgi:hypothetical protein
MVFRLLLGVLLASVVWMGWGFVFWEYLPFGHDALGRLPDEARVVGALQESAPETGVYFSPLADRETMSGNDPKAKEALERRHKSGPLVQIIYRKEGVENVGAVFALGFAHFLVSSLLVGLLLLLALPGLGGYLPRVLFVALAGLFASVAITLAQPIWFHHPWKFSLTLAGFYAAGWLLAGVVMGLVIRPRA